MVLIAGALSLSAVAGALAVNVSASPSTSQLTITSQDTSGNPLTGFYTVLNESSTVIASGFTPYTFILNDSQNYMVQADNYGSCYFAYWLDNGLPYYWRTVSISTDTQFVAVYDCNAASSISVTAVNQNGQALIGYYAVLSQSGSVVGTGFTPASFSTIGGQPYTITVYNYGGCFFTSWGDLGSSEQGTEPTRNVTGPSGHWTYRAIYTCNPPTSGSSTLSVSTANGDGASISGYYISLWQNGIYLESCFSACFFTVNNGQTYQLTASSYGSESFSHWQNDGSSGAETVSVPASSSTLDYVAVFSP